MTDWIKFTVGRKKRERDILKMLSQKDMILLTKTHMKIHVDEMVPSDVIFLLGALQELAALTDGKRYAEMQERIKEIKQRLNDMMR